ncbi:MAG: GNAT family N-acetyltransferase [Acidobacteriota bacterium]|nr:GNAT family N-acetyltransferase [Acidobacteriota bacterium]
MISDDVNAIETISRNCFRSFANFPGAELIDDGRVFGVMSHLPITFFSGIATTCLDSNEIDREVESIIDIFRARQCAFRWWLTPSTQPQGLGAVLAAHGMRHAYDAPGMAADLMAVDLDAPPPAMVTIRKMANATELQHWLAVFVAAFERSPEEGEHWLDAYIRCGFGDDAAWTHFVGDLGDEPVATTSVLVEGALAGIYFVATLPAARGRGIGAAVTRAAMRYARDAGATRAALQSSDLGYSVYRSLGFVDRCMLSLYEWPPEG